MEGGEQMDLVCVRKTELTHKGRLRWIRRTTQHFNPHLPSCVVLKSILDENGPSFQAVLRQHQDIRTSEPH